MLEIKELRFRQLKESLWYNYRIKETIEGEVIKIQRKIGSNIYYHQEKGGK